MMAGAWISWIGERLLHADTFALILSPAIADLQFEGPTLHALRPRHHCGVLRAVFGALCFDIIGDVVALGSDASMIAGLAFLQTSYYSFMLVLLSGLGTGKIRALDVRSPAVTHAIYYVIAIAAACVVTTSVCFWPTRRARQNDSGA